MNLDPSLGAQDLLIRCKVVIQMCCEAQGATEVLEASNVEDARFERGQLFLTWRVLRDVVKSAGAILPQLEAVLKKEAGNRDVTIVMTAHREDPITDKKPGRPQGGHRPFALAQDAASDADEGPSVIKRIGKVIAVASGKGGVGKSTTAINLAVGLAQKGLRVGMLDADIYGPSLPRMLGHAGKPEIRAGKIVPVDAWGIKAISIGFLVDETQAMIWRGPMVMGAISQFINDVAWPELDVMVVDLPPGTGDAQLSIAQKLPLAGVVIVSTPQDIALLDARRGIAMFKQLKVPIMGLVENMSYFCCPNCNSRTELFNHGGARAEAEIRGVTFLGEVPLLLEIRQSGDAGRPAILHETGDEAARCYRNISDNVFRQLSV